ncbi:MAG: glutamate formiminotransferase / formiminotetrahydrofolate cyclodeaminase [Chloroflexota bacterium]|nr:glutamate formiminotransferase / formiminotetrahydrofolate cyclodeaminase [Chloroflexota bacterium]
MAYPLVECIPNFSEGRRPEVVEQIKAAVTSVSGVKLLDGHSDPDHNRTVLTILGAPQAVKEAVFRAIAKAAELIDMDQHQGEHPRLGATDVVPFVPIREVSMADCVALAQELGKQVGEELGIPVYLYEAAAARPERTNLEDVRRGQYELLKEELGVKAERDPDFGPRKLGKAGATIIGAREPLIAYNIYLNSDDVSIAKKIAKTVRFSSGGLRYVKAMGVMVEDQAQVSMNLTNFRKTPIALVYETVVREAQRYGTSPHHSELVGLIPQEALVDAAVWYTQMDQFEPEQILENRLAGGDNSQAEAGENFLDALASDAPTPGGGSAAAFTAAEAAALVAMVARLTLGKKKYAEVEDQMKDLAEQADALRAQLNAAIAEDSQAFEAVMQAYRLPKEDEAQVEQRNVAIQAATLQAARVPLQTAETTLEVMRLAEQAAAQGNLNAITDAWSAAVLAHAAISCAGANVRINLSGLKDEQETRALGQRLAVVDQAAEKLLKDIRTNIKNRAGIDLL